MTSAIADVPLRAANPTIDVSPRIAARVAGWGILAMALIAPFSEFYVRQRLVVPGDAAATATNITAHETLMRFGILGFVGIVVLDVVVAWALYVLFKPVNRSVAVLMGWFRLGYAAIFAYAVINLLDALRLVGGAGYLTAFTPDQLHAQMMVSLASFDSAWAVALVLFGIHLIMVGYLAFASRHMPRFVGILLAIAGAGYLADSLIVVVKPDYQPTAALFTFVGEVVFMLWLLIRGATVPDIHATDRDPLDEAAPIPSAVIVAEHLRRGGV
jgi:hypothetical protein